MKGIGFVIALALVGCSAPDDAAQTEVDAISNGTKDKTHDAVVAIDIGGQALCSGSLVAPNMVLTARHCVSYTSEEVDCAHGGAPTMGDRDPKTLGIHVGQSVLGTSAVAHGKKLVLPKVNKLCGDDAAVIVLDRNVPNIQPLEIGAAPASGSYVTVVGFGQQGDDGNIGVRMKRRSRILDATSSEIEVGESSCPGDSGGPALDSKGRIVGIVSRGSSPCSGSGATNIFSRADAHADLLKN